jgi:hypothetical protein
MLHSNNPTLCRLHTVFAALAVLVELIFFVFCLQILESGFSPMVFAVDVGILRADIERK